MLDTEQYKYKAVARDSVTEPPGKHAEGSEVDMTWAEQIQRVGSLVLLGCHCCGHLC